MCTSGLRTPLKHATFNYWLGETRTGIQNGQAICIASQKFHVAYANLNPGIGRLDTIQFSSVLEVGEGPSQNKSAYSTHIAERGRHLHLVLQSFTNLTLVFRGKQFFSRITVYLSIHSLNSATRSLLTSISSAWSQVVSTSFNRLVEYAITS